MTKKIDISQMTTEEIVPYVEKVKQQNRDRVNKHYNNTINGIMLILNGIMFGCNNAD
jgi:hypothetical protein